MKEFMDVCRRLPDACDYTRSTRCWSLMPSGPSAEQAGMEPATRVYRLVFAVGDHLRVRTGALPAVWQG